MNRYNTAIMSIIVQIIKINVIALINDLTGLLYLMFLFG